MSYYVIVSQSPVEACNVSCNITKLWQKPHQSHSQGHQNLQAPMMTGYGGVVYDLLDQGQAIPI